MKKYEKRERKVDNGLRVAVSQKSKVISCIISSHSQFIMQMLFIFIYTFAFCVVLSTSHFKIRKKKTYAKVGEEEYFYVSVLYETIGNLDKMCTRVKSIHSTISVFVFLCVYVVRNFDVFMFVWQTYGQAVHGCNTNSKATRNRCNFSFL